MDFLLLLLFIFVGLEGTHEPWAQEEVTEQLSRVGFLLLPGDYWVLNSDPNAWLQIPLPVEPS